MNEPPADMIAVAVEAATLGPCAKSKRGVVIYDLYEDFKHVLGAAYNAPPPPFVCDGSLACRSACGRICVHAEVRAMHVYPSRWHAPSPGSHDAVHLIHVKVVDRELVPGGPPSCEACSKIILDSGMIGTVWLYEAQRWHTEVRCKACRRVTIIAQGAGTTGVCKLCDEVYNLLDFDKTVYDVTSGQWRRYTPVEFHAATLYNCALPAARGDSEVERG